MRGRHDPASDPRPRARAAVAADPGFLSAQLLAMNFFTARGNDKDALTAAKQVLVLAPANLDAARRVARGSLAGGDVPSALSAYGVLLKHSSNDAEALNAMFPHMNVKVA